MEKYLPYADGKHIKTAETMPLYFKPRTPLSLHDLMVSMRDHFENTPFAIQGDAGAGLYDMPYRPSPLFFTHNGRKYFNERPISTMQTASTMIAQMRRDLPMPSGGYCGSETTTPTWWPTRPSIAALNASPHATPPKQPTT